MKRLVALAAVVLLAAGCAGATQYAPRVVARGELTLRFDGNFEMWAAGRKVASAWTYEGLADHVRCVPQAEAHARSARSSGYAAVVLSALGGVFGAAALAAGIGAAIALSSDQLEKRDLDRLWPWVGGGLGVAAVGTLFAGLGRLSKNAANGHAVDAMNTYNDAVGSLGATCDDLVYPPPIAAPPDAP